MKTDVAAISRVYAESDLFQALRDLQIIALDGDVPETDRALAQDAFTAVSKALELVRATSFEDGAAAPHRIEFEKTRKQKYGKSKLFKDFGVRKQNAQPLCQVDTKGDKNGHSDQR